MARLDTVRALQLFSFARFGSTLLISILLVRLGLPAADIAVYETLLFWSAAVTAFWVSGGQTAVLSLFPQLRKDGVAAGLLWQVALLFFGLSSLSALVIYFGAPFYFQAFTPFEKLPYVGLIALYSWLNVPAFLLHIFYQLRGQDRALLWMSGLNWGAQLGAVIGPLLLGYSLEMVFQSLVLLGLLRALWLFGLLRKTDRLTLSLITLRRYGRLWVPLALTALLEGSVELIDGLLVGRCFDDPAVFTYYRYGAKELPLSLLLIGPVVAVGIQAAASDMAGGLREARERLRRIGHVLYPLSAVLLLAAPYLFTWAYSADYSVSAQLFGVYLLLISSRLLVPQIVLVAREHNYALLVISIIEVMLNAVLSYLLIGPLGLLGIAWGSVIAYLVGKGLLAAYAYARLGVPLMAYLPVREWVLGNVGLFLLWWWI